MSSATIARVIDHVNYTMGEAEYRRSDHLVATPQGDHHHDLPGDQGPHLAHDDTLTWLPLHISDATEVHQLLSTSDRHDGATRTASLIEVESWFDGSWVNPIRDTIGGYHGRVLVACAFVDHRPHTDSIDHISVKIAVHPRYRSPMRESAIVRWATEQAQQCLAQQPGRNGSKKARIVHQVTGRSATRLHSLEQHGYQVKRHVRTMRRDLSQPVADVKLHDNLTIHRWNADLDDLIRQTHNEVFHGVWGATRHTEETWARERAQLWAPWSFAVLDHNASSTESEPMVVGFVLCGRHDEQWEHTGVLMGHIETVGVRPQYRRRGVTTALLVHTLAVLARQGVQCANIDVDIDEHRMWSLCARLGFDDIATSLVYSKEINI